MRLGRSGKPVRDPIFEMIEDFLLFNTPGTGSSAVAYVTRGAAAGLSASANEFGTGGGGAVPTIGVTRDGFVCRRFAPGTNQLSSFETKFSLPLARDLSVIPVSARRQHRIVFETVVQRVTPLTAGVKFEVGVKDDPGTALTTSNGGLILQSVSTVNAGRWTLWTRAHGGAATQGGDSGIAPDGTPQHFRFEYFDRYPSPALLIWINGTLKYTIDGATLTALSPGSSNEPWSCGLSSGDAAANTIGQNDHNYFNRFAIDLL